MTEEYLYKKPDLHMHSTFSDGTDTPKKLVENVRAAGLDLFSLTDHDTADGCAIVHSLLHRGDPRFIGGIELSCSDDLGKYHILGYCYDYQKSSIRDAVQLAHNIRIRKFKSRFDYLRETHGYQFTEEEIAELFALKNPGKPHIAKLLIRKGYVKTMQEGIGLFKHFISPVEYLTPEYAIESILESNGIPVLAHGILGDGSDDLTEDQIGERVRRLKMDGLMGLECYYSTYTPQQKEIMLSLAEKNNLMITAGSDYHGSTKVVQLGDTNSPDPERLKRFYNAVNYLL